MSLTLGTNTYDHVSGGKHLLSTVTFGNPEQSVKISPFTKRKNGYTGGLTLHVQADVTENGDTVRIEDSVAVQFIGSSRSDIARFRTAFTELNAFVQSAEFPAMLTGKFVY